MKKLLLIAILMLALVITAVACTETPDEPDTSADDVTTAETPTEAPTDEPDDTPEPEVTTPAEPEETTPAEPDVTTEPEVTTPAEPEVTTEPEPETTVDPDIPVHVIDPEFINEQALSTGGQTFTNNIGSSEVITEGNKTFTRLTTSGGDPYVTIVNIGSNLTLPQYMAISYRTNSTAGGQFFMGSGQGWSGQGDSFDVEWIEGGWSFMVIDLTQTALTSLTDGLINYARFDFFKGPGDEGDYFDIQYVAFFNSVEAARKYDFELNKAPMWDADKAVVAHQSFDQFYYGNGHQDDAVKNDLNLYHAASKPDWNKVADMVGSGFDSLTYWGWIATTSETIGQFGYQVNGGSPIYNAEWTHETEQGVLDAAKTFGGVTGSRMKITISTAAFDGETSVRILYKDAEGNVVCLNEITVIAPVKPKDITDTFVSDVASNEEGSDLQSSDLANYFTITYGAGTPHTVTGGQYCYGSINEMYTDMNGLYAFIIDMQEAANTAMMFVRGTHAVHSDDLPAQEGTLYVINNYYETDGNGLMGGAGIYAAIYNGKLNIMVKYYDDATKTHVGNKLYSVPVEGTELTIADDGQTVYFLADGELAATIALSGEIEYEKLDVTPAIKFAQTAVVTLADGTTETIENTLVASTHESQIGIAVRPATMKFTSLKVLGFSDVEIPEDFYLPTPKVNVALGKPVNADSVENTQNIASNMTDGNDTTRWGALKNGLANAIVDLEAVYTITGMDVLFENASWNYEIAISVDGDKYDVIHESGTHGAKLVALKLDNVEARYIKFTRLDDSAEAGDHWFSIYEVYVYAAGAEDAPDASPALTVDLSTVVTGEGAVYVTAWPEAGFADTPVIQMTNWGSHIDLGEMDLSQYSKVVVTYGSDGSAKQGDVGTFMALTKNGAVENTDSSDKTDAEIIAQATMSNATGGWTTTRTVTIEFESDYVGHVYLAQDMKDTNGACIVTIEFYA